MPLIMKDGKAYGQSPSGLSGLIDTDIQNPSANQVLAYDGSKWANTAIIKTTTASGTTTNSGALALPTGINAENVIACVGTNGTLHRYAFPRGDTDGYLQVLKIENNALVACPSESVNFKVIYY